MATKLQSIRGMNDILPTEMAYWQFVENILQTTTQSYGYEEIRFPIVEATGLFKRSIGEVTDIVEKEMYTFLDRNGESLTLRPEGTASCVRAGLQHSLFHHETPRVWYRGPMFRYERPQMGRYRQFYQMGVEAYGFKGPDIDAELIAMSRRYWQVLGISDQIRLEINCLGNEITRSRYREVLTEYLHAHFDQLDEDSQRRLATNPLRILDSKNPTMVTLIANAPNLLDYLDSASNQHFEELQVFLNELDIAYKVNSRLVRGLDYYTGIVFEWISENLGAQGTVCAGGRYDNLVAQLGGNPTCATGFALGLERLINLVKLQFSPQHVTPLRHIYMIHSNKEAEKVAMRLAEKIRAHYPHYRVILHCGESSFKSQFKRADKIQAQLALIIGEEELQNDTVTVKFLQADKLQQQFSQQALISLLEQWFEQIKK